MCLTSLGGSGLCKQCKFTLSSIVKRKPGLKRGQIQTVDVLPCVPNKSKTEGKVIRDS